MLNDMTNKNKQDVRMFQYLKSHYPASGPKKNHQENDAIIFTSGSNSKKSPQNCDSRNKTSPTLCCPPYAHTHVYIC